MNNILQYQKLDIELDKLIKQKSSLEELNIIEKMKNIVKNAQNNSIKLEGEAEQLLNEYNKLKEAYNIQNSKIQKLTNLSIDKLTRDEITQHLMTINAISSELFMIERNLNIVIKC